MKRFTYWIVPLRRDYPVLVISSQDAPPQGWNNYYYEITRNLVLGLLRQYRQLNQRAPIFTSRAFAQEREAPYNAVA